MDYIQLDDVGKQLIHLEPGDYGMPATTLDALVAGCLKGWLINMPQKQRIAALRQLVRPVWFEMYVEGDRARVNVTYAMLHEKRFRVLITSLADKGKQEFQKTLPSYETTTLAYEVRTKAIEALQNVIDAYRVNEMSRELGGYIRAMYSIVMSG